MSKIYLTLFISLIFVSNAFAQLRISHARYQQMLQNGQHEAMAKEVRLLIKNNQYAKNWKLYVYIALASCKEGQSERGRELFDLIKEKLDLEQSQIDVIDQYKSACLAQGISQTMNLNSFLSNIFLAMNNQPEGSSAGKFGYVIDCSKMTSSFSISESFDQSDMQNRLFEINEKDKAVNYYRKILPGQDYKINASGRFIIITPSSKIINQELVDEASEGLEKVYKYYHTTFNVSAPDKLIAVYLMEDKKKLQKVALKTHGLALPDDNIGYSNLSDLSVLGNSRKDRFGTIKHELFHLMIRTDIGDIPAWLDEGIASSFAESHWDGGGRLVTDNYSWRTQTLRDANKRFGNIPTLFELFENGWNMFKNNGDMSVCDLSVNYALAEHFIYFLEDQEKLFDLVELFKHRRTPFLNKYYRYEEDITIVEMVFNKPLLFIQNDFNAWMKNNYGIVAYYSFDEIDRLANQLFSQLENTNTCNQVELHYIKSEYGSKASDLNHLRPMEENLKGHMIIRDYSELINYYSIEDYYNYRFFYECVDNLSSNIYLDEYGILRDFCQKLREYNYKKGQLLSWLQSKYESGFGCRRFRIR